MDAWNESLRTFAPSLIRSFVWPMLWQSSVLIVVLFTLDGSLRRKIRPSVRYALWLVLLLKLVLPPSLAVPTAVAWWVRPATQAPTRSSPATVLVTSDRAALETTFHNADYPAQPAAPRAILPLSAWALLGSGAVSFGLLVWMVVRWVQVARLAHRATPAPAWLQDLVGEAQARLSGPLDDARIGRPVALRLTDARTSPAVCGLFRSLILLPQSLVERLSTAQLRAVLLHELIHLRRRDVWVNYVQSLLQILYWWHPLLWLANARIRQLREEAVDDAAVLALREEADSYAPTLLEVARLALSRPLASLATVGILEWKSALRQRIERLVNLKAPPKAGLTLLSIFGILIFTMAAVPMGEAPASREQPSANASAVALNSGARAAKPGADQPTSPQVLVNRSNRGRQLILAKLEALRFDVNDVKFKDMPLGQLLNALADLVRKEDRSEAGINFTFSNDAPLMPVRLDPNTGLPVDFPAPTVNLAAIPITLGFAKEEVRLIDVLDGIVHAADPPVKYAVEDSGVVFSRRTENAASPLYVRTFRVDPNTFKERVAEALGRPEAASPEEAFQNFKDLLANLGVDLNPPNTVFYADRRGDLFVRATLSDLDAIESAVAKLSVTPPQIHIKAKFIRIPAGELADLANALGMTLEPNETNVVLTEAQVGLLGKTLQERPDIELMAEASVTTLSGRASEIQIVPDNQQPSPGGNAPVEVASGQSSVLTAATNPPPSLGLQIVPRLLPDEVTIHLELTPVITEFLGYETSNAATNSATAQKPLPHFRLYLHNVSATVPDGQTLVMDAFTAEDKAKRQEQIQALEGMKQKVPVLGDIPVVSRMFENERGVNDKRLLILVTPTLIDPAGNRTHPDGGI